MNICTSGFAYFHLITKYLKDARIRYAVLMKSSNLISIRIMYVDKPCCDNECSGC